MDIKKVEEMAIILNTFGLTRIEVRDDDGKAIVVLEKSQTYMHPEEMTAHSKRKNKNDSAMDAESFLPTDVANPVPDHSIINIKSPIVGVFYSASSQGALPFVSIGSQVKQGDVLCIIESMKLMNEITTNHSGEIVDICVKNGEIVEYGQVLFTMKYLEE